MPLAGGYISVLKITSYILSTVILKFWYECVTINFLLFVRFSVYRIGFFFLKKDWREHFLSKTFFFLSSCPKCCGAICCGIGLSIPSLFTSGPSGRACRPSAGLCFRGRRRGCRHAGCPRRCAGCPRQVLLPCTRRYFGCRPLAGAGTVPAAAGRTAREEVGRVGAAAAAGCSSSSPSSWPALGPGQPTPVGFAWQPVLPPGRLGRPERSPWPP